MLEMLCTMGYKQGPKIIPAESFFSTLSYMTYDPTRGWLSSLYGLDSSGGWVNELRRKLDVSPLDLSRLKRVSGVWSGSYGGGNVYANCLVFTLSDGKSIRLGILDGQRLDVGQYLHRGVYPDPAQRLAVNYSNEFLSYEVPEGVCVTKLETMMGGCKGFAQNGTHGVKDLFFEFE